MLPTNYSFTNHIYIYIYIYKQDLVLNNLQGLIYQHSENQPGNTHFCNTKFMLQDKWLKSLSGPKFSTYAYMWMFDWCLDITNQSLILW